ncbi:MAG: hypothetical protein ACI80S_001489 [Pseudohongiellaceae bacterium]|jgi:hypothetical protein
MSGFTAGNPGMLRLVFSILGLFKSIMLRPLTTSLFTFTLLIYSVVSIFGKYYLSNFFKIKGSSKAEYNGIVILDVRLL